MENQEDLKKRLREEIAHLGKFKIDVVQNYLSCDSSARGLHPFKMEIDEMANNIGLYRRLENSGRLKESDKPALLECIARTLVAYLKQEREGRLVEPKSVIEEIAEKLRDFATWLSDRVDSADLKWRSLLTLMIRLSQYQGDPHRVPRACDSAPRQVFLRRLVENLDAMPCQVSDSFICAVGELFFSSITTNLVRDARKAVQPLLWSKKEPRILWNHGVAANDAASANNFVTLNYDKLLQWAERHRKR